MSGGGGGVIIINGLIQSGQLNADECLKLREIQDRSIVRCTWLDAWRVARIVRKAVRRS